MYNTRELIELSIRKQLLNELFSETLSDLPQAVITINNADNIDLDALVHKLSADDILITNDQYNTEKADFMVINSSGDVVLNVSPEGDRINNVTFDYYLEEDTAFDKLVRIYDTLKRSGYAYTVKINE